MKHFKHLLVPDDAAGGGGAGGAGGGGGAGGAGGGASADETAKAIEKARLEERKKLADQLSAALAQAEALKTQLSALQAAKDAADAELTTLKTAHESLKAGIKQEGGVDIEKAIQTAVTAALSRQGPALQAEIASLRQELEAEKSKREAVELEQMRLQIIEENGGSTALIPELVSGKTVEELKASADKSKAILARSLEAAGGSSAGGGSTANGTGKSGLQSVPLGNKAGASGGGVPPRSVFPSAGGGRISLKEYAQNREKLKAEAIARARTQ